MKTTIIIFIIIALVFLVTQAYTSMSTSTTEKQKYSLLFKEKDFEIRKYDASILASVKMQGSYDQMSGSGFRELASYIFGNNQQGMKISMTSPVRMQLNDSSTTMSFIMPSKFDMESLPEPNSQNVWLAQSKTQVTASIRFGAYANDQIIGTKIKKLKEILNERNIKHLNDFTYLGYNPPYLVVGRKNEIFVTLIDYVVE